MAPEYGTLSDGSELTGDESDDYASVPRTPSKKRRRVIPQDDEEDEDQVADALEDDDDEDADADADADELDDDDEDFDAPSTSKRGATRTSGRTSTREVSTPKRSARTSTRSAASTPASTGKKSLRVKLTRIPNAAATAPVDTSSPASTKSRPSRSAAILPTRRAKDASKVKWKAHTTKDSPSPDEILMPDDDDLDLDDSASPSRAATLDPDANTATDDSASEPDEATAAEVAAIIGKTARQLAREGGVESEHMELPMFDPNRKKKLTENELALRRSETARKRKNQVEKKLEDDKVETINRLLKKQVGRSRNKLPRAGSEENSDEEVERQRKRGREELSRKALKEVPSGWFRMVDGNGGKVLAVPLGPPWVDDVLGTNHLEVDRALIDELDTPAVTQPLTEKAKALQDKARKRFDVQSQRWKQDHALDDIWGQEGLYEYQLRTALGQSRSDWIGSRRPPTPEPQPHLQQHQHAQTMTDADADQHQDDVADHPPHPADDQESSPHAHLRS